MTAYSGQLLRVDQASGETSTTFLTVTDSDTLMQSQDAGTLYNLCGVDMAAPPVLDQRQISGTLLDGTAYSYSVAHFIARGKDYYILPAALPPEAVASVTTSTPIGPVTPFDYFSHGQTVMYGALQSGQALSVRFNAAGRAVQTSVTDAVVTDADDLILNDNAGDEYDGGATAMFGPDFTSPLGIDDVDTASRQMVLVRVFYTGATTDGSFVALRVSHATDSGTQAYYLPRTGTVDLDDVVAFRREKLLGGSAEDLSYADFGLGNTAHVQTGTAAADLLQGTVLPDDLIGKDGADWLVGGLAADRLDGGAGNDALHGGAQDDTLIGGLGNDDLFGGNDRDSMVGGLGNDSFLGAWGADTLFGGDGNDRLGAGSDNDQVFGGAGNDSLIGYDGDDMLSDGSGADSLNGGQGADTFVLVADGATDRIVSFESGIDRIDLDAAFAALTITTLSPGHQQILHNGDVLLIDTVATLTAADFL